MLRMRFKEQQFSQKTIPKLVRTRERSTASWAPFAGGCLLSFQCCLRANGVILKEDGVLPSRLKHHFNFPKSVTSAEW